MDTEDSLDTALCIVFVTTFHFCNIKMNQNRIKFLNILFINA